MSSNKYIEKFLKCPLTNLFYYDPVIAEDGYVYEHMAIVYWLNNDKRSPKTDELINKRFISAKHQKELVNEYLKENPDLIEERFTNKKPYYLFKGDFINDMLNGIYNNLHNYTDILLNDYMNNGYTVFYYLIANCKNKEIIKRVIDNSIDMDMCNDKGTRPIHIACKYGDIEIIKYLVNKKVSLDKIDNITGDKCIHFLYKNDIYDNDLIKIFLTKDSANSFDKDGFLPIHILAKKFTSWDQINPFLDIEFDIGKESKEGYSALHYICRFCDNIDLIKQFISLNIKLGIMKENNNKIDRMIYNNTNLNIENRQKIVYFYLDKMLNRTTIISKYYESSNDDKKYNDIISYIKNRELVEIREFDE